MKKFLKLSLMLTLAIFLTACSAGSKKTVCEVSQLGQDLRVVMEADGDKIQKYTLEMEVNSQIFDSNLKSVVEEFDSIAGITVSTNERAGRTTVTIELDYNKLDLESYDLSSLGITGDNLDEFRSLATNVNNLKSAGMTCK